MSSKITMQVIVICETESLKYRKKTDQAKAPKTPKRMAMMLIKVRAAVAMAMLKYQTLVNWVAGYFVYSHAIVHHYRP